MNSKAGFEKPQYLQAIQMKAEDLLKWFNDDLLPTVVKNGHLSEKGEVQSHEKCEFEAIEKAVNSFASTPGFAKVTLNTHAGHVSRNVFVKFQSQDPEFREKMKLTLQFQNEVTMYSKILPGFADFLKFCGQSKNLLRELVPKCHFAMDTKEDPEKSIVILEDLRNVGYRLPSSVTDLDLEHCLIGFERLAQFHAVSYAMKLRKWNLFDEFKDSFVQVWFEDNEFTRKQCEDFVAHCSMRGIDYLMSQKNSEVPVKYLENLKKMLDPKGLFDFLRSLRSPKEPLAVICHGDFNRNNVLYKYMNGKVVDAKLTDFQTFMYGSPNLDLSFFIYMNTTLELRERHFDELLNHYHSTLIKRISLILNEPEGNISNLLPSEAFREDFASVAITAYVTVAFFLPVMMVPPQSDFEEDMKEKSFKELASMNYELGGDYVSKRVAEVIVDFYRRKFYV